MRYLIPVMLLLCACANNSLPGEAQATNADQQPNILLIMADDLGFSDIGVFGGEIATPNLDQLANQGVQLLNFHTAPTCGPTRGMLMTGIDSHRVGTGANAAALQRLTMLQGRPGYEGYLNQDVATLPERLAVLGYQNFMVGKWDLGGEPQARPAQRGFDRSFALIESGGSYFADMRGNFPFEPRIRYFEDDMLVESLPDDFYATSFYTDKLIQFLGETDSRRPWFAYAAYTAPHWPLQVPQDYELPQGYEAGWQAIAKERLQRIEALGLYSGLPVGESLTSADWDSLDEVQQAEETKRMALYAAMVEILDSETGRLIAAARHKSADRPLVILFLSDNGPEGNNIAGIGTTGQWIQAEFDLSYESMGAPGSYAWTGQQWSEVSAQPFSLFKSFVSEGGIRTPAIISAPGLSGRSNQLTSVMDLLPTLVEMAGGDAQRQSTFDHLLPVQGVSMLPALKSPESVFDRPALGFELYGNRAIIDGHYKARLIWPPAGSGQWQLYDLSADPSESTDLARIYPQVLEGLIAQWHEYAESNGVYLFDHDNGYGRYEEYAP